ncbi:hypothetical protein LCGC14_2147820 [marine sediment metagenome]|uniref:Uncharacterized protein n=1 Tax=marine sediment metagenome TaxID=412755 RepID=A0A0F9G9C8_9ZZZZ
MDEIIYEGSELFGEGRARLAAEQEHVEATNHRLSCFYWVTRCLDCGWEVSLGVVSGDPFNLNSTAVQRVTVWNP